MSICRTCRFVLLLALGAAPLVCWGGAGVVKQVERPALAGLDLQAAQGAHAAHGDIPSSSGGYGSDSSSSSEEAPGAYALSRAHIFQGGYDHVNLILLQCLTRVLAPLREAGLVVRRASSLCVQRARERLDAGAADIERRYAAPPATDPELEEDVAVIQRGLNARQRYPASSVMEKRAMNASYSLARADPALAPVRRAFVDLEAQIWEQLADCLRRVWEAASPEAARPVGFLYKCIQHRVGDQEDEAAIEAGIPPAYVQELKRLRMRGVNV